VIIAAALLVLAGLGLFVGGLLTGLQTLYWACVAVCVVAAVLLFLARRSPPSAAGATGAEPVGATAQPAAGTAHPAGATGNAAADPAKGKATAAPAEGTTAGSAPAPRHAPVEEEPPVEEEEVTDLLLVVDLKDEVLVVDEHPRYHLAGCRFLAGRTGIPLPLDEARTDGFTPCAWCAPHRELAAQVRARKAAGSS
jgi:hypothetical protein